MGSARLATRGARIGPARCSLVAAALASLLACDRGEEIATAILTREEGAGASARYEVSLEFLAPPTPPQQAAFERARQRIESVIVGDLPDVTLGPTAECPGVAPRGVVDDLLVVVQLEAIDGPGGIVGSAGPCLLRRSGLPAVGVARFDTADLARLEESGALDAVIEHELLHVVGVGSLWDHLGLVAGGAADPHFVGPGARAAFLDANGGGAYAGAAVPVEDTGAAGTAGVHWREDVLGDELMTGWVTGSDRPLSLTTVMSLADMGYEVEPSSAEPFDVAALRALLADDRLPLGDDVLALPLATVE